MDKELVRLVDFSSNPKEVSDFITTTFTLINLAQRQGVTLPDAYFEGIIITTELILNKKLEPYGK